jgi:uncharacterized protein YndB with AHSA1/START domain
VITREFNVPRALVFETMSKPEHAKRWWGTRNTEMPVCEIDFRVGGTWRYVLRDRETGHEDAFSGEYREIVAPEKVVFTERYEPIPGSDHVVTGTLTDHGGTTTLRVHIQYTSVERRDGHLRSATLRQ